MSQGELKLADLVDTEVAPGVWLITEPKPTPNTDKLSALANIGGALCLVELSLRFP